MQSRIADSRKFAIRKTVSIRFSLPLEDRPMCSVSPSNIDGSMSLPTPMLRASWEILLLFWPSGRETLPKYCYGRDLGIVAAHVRGTDRGAVWNGYRRQQRYSAKCHVCLAAEPNVDTGHVGAPSSCPCLSDRLRRLFTLRLIEEHSKASDPVSPHRARTEIMLIDLNSRMCRKQFSWSVV